MDDATARALIEERGRGATCGVCGGTEWAMAGDGKPITLLSFAATDQPRIRVLAIVCCNCGYVRFHSLEALTAPKQASPTD